MALPKVNILEFSENYLSTLVELVQSTIRNCYPEVYPDEVVDFFLNYHSKKEIQKRISNKEVFLFLAMQDNVLLGTGYLNKKEIGGVYIRNSKQRQGIGNLIVTKLLQLARERKLDHVWLDSTLIAKEFYLHMGFQIYEKKTDYVKNNIPLHYYRMHMKL